MGYVWARTVTAVADTHIQIPLQSPAATSGNINLKGGMGQWFRKSLILLDTLAKVNTLRIFILFPLYPQKSALLRRQRRSLGRYSSLAD
jgi:hypothetical protein